MSDGVTIKTNLPDFKNQMRELGIDFERRVFRAGVGSAAKVFRQEVERRVPVKSGKLKRAVYIKRAKDSRNGKEHYFVGVRQGKASRSVNIRHGGKLVGTGNLDAFYWRWVEQGHLIRRSKITGGRRSQALQRSRLSASGAARVPAQPFLAPAFSAKQGEALQAFNERVQQRIDKANAK